MSDTDLATFLSGFDGFELIAPTVRLLALGGPVTIDDLAAASGQAADHVAAVLHAQAGTEWDTTGRLVGFGLTPQRTAHRFTVAGRTLYTWCASDALFFPLILDQRATVESACPESAQAIRLDVAPDRIVALDPPTTVVSQLHDPACLDDIRAKVCDQGHFFASPQAAARWTTQHPSGTLQPIQEAFASIRRTCQQLGWTPADTGS